MAHLACRQHRRRVYVFQKWIIVDAQGFQQWIPATIHRADGSACQTREVRIGPVTLTPDEVIDRAIDGAPLYGVGKKYSEYQGRHRSGK